MVKLKIYEDEKEVPDSSIYLRLCKSTEGNNIELEVVGRDTGERVLSGTLLKITSNGHLELCDGIDANLGLKLDDDGKILIK